MVWKSKMVGERGVVTVWDECVMKGCSKSSYLYVFFFNDTATTEIYTLSLHDALPI